MNYLLTHLDDAWTLTLIHLRLSLVPLVLGLLIAVPLGARHPVHHASRAGAAAITVIASIIFTIPSLALFVVLPLIIPTRILDQANVIVALHALHHRAAGAGRARGAGRGAARRAGRGHRRRLPTVHRILKVELPLAIPVLVASLRVVAVTNISMVSVGSVIGIGGLGT